jgi:hypothetical protein
MLRQPYNIAISIIPSSFPHVETPEYEELDNRKV